MHSCIGAMDNTSSPADAVEVTLLLPIQERVKKTYETLEADFSKIGSKIHRFPQGLRWIGGEGDRYIVPSVVALGPYHHGLPHLHKMEKVKHAAAYYFCTKSGHSVEEVYGKILSVAGEARDCYDWDGDVKSLSDTEFAEMMFLDGCFLLYYISFDGGSRMLKNRVALSTGFSMLRDMLLLENQIPWLVLDALMTFKPVDVHGFLSRELMAFIDGGKGVGGSREDDISNWHPTHLLGLARSFVIGGMPPHLELGYRRTCTTQSSSAVELAEMGIKLIQSKKKCFADMSLSSSKAPLFGELSLSPMFLADVTACWLVNMAALEACTACSVVGPSDGLVVSAYLSILAMLMDKEEDVHELRAKHIINSFFSDEEMLAFFKGLAKHFRLGIRYFAMIEKIQDYKRERRVAIVMHKFFYNNWKTIVTLLSIASVLVGIFKALFSLKKQ